MGWDREEFTARLVPLASPAALAFRIVETMPGSPAANAGMKVAPALEEMCEASLAKGDRTRSTMTMKRGIHQ